MCYPNPCGPNGLCRPSSGGSFVCSCTSGYFGTPCRPECTVNTDCPMDRSCLNQKCVDPCPGVCGINAICSVMAHSPKCSCKERFTGNPYSRCYGMDIAKEMIMFIIYHLNILDLFANFSIFYIICNFFGNFFHIFVTF